MRSFLRKTALVLSLIALVFFLSCERHHVGELTGETDAPGHEQTTADQSTATTNTSHTAQPPESAPPQHSHPASSPSPRNSPANFFPDKPKP